jgi:hypothetical protein
MKRPFALFLSIMMLIYGTFTIKGDLILLHLFYSYDAEEDENQREHIAKQDEKKSEKSEKKDIEKEKDKKLCDKKCDKCMYGVTRCPVRKVNET